MVGLSDIPCLGKALDAISDATVQAASRGLRYLCCYDTFVNDLNDKIAKLIIQEDLVNQRVVAEQNDGKIIKGHVVEWQEKDVPKIKGNVQNLVAKYSGRISWTCFKYLSLPNPVSRFRYGRHASKNAEEVLRVTASGINLLANEIADYKPKDNLPISDTAYRKFDSRQEVYDKIWEALIKEEDNPILGIYGMPGVGKTRMMEQVWKEAKEKNIFHHVARANVGDKSMDVNLVLDLQKQLAGHLDCNLKSPNNEVDRASQLKARLSNRSQKFLLIFDDVWGEIPLERIIGIPFQAGIPTCEDESKWGNKILFTSRTKDVCLSNNCKTHVQVKTLTKEEAWLMFQGAVGTTNIDSIGDEDLAKKVCEKCACLPLLIYAVGKSLKFKPKASWENALQHFEDSKFDSISGIDPNTYACVKVSFDNLSEQEKSCIVLSSLFPEDAVIRTSALSDIATGTRLFDGGKVRMLVDILKSCSLLLEGDGRGSFKLHDVVRDVAKSIAETDAKYAFLFMRCESRLLDRADFASRKLMQLHLERDDIRFGDDFVCPHLHTMWLECNGHKQEFSDTFFKMLVNLEFLVIRGMNFSQSRMPSQTLDKLNVLMLDGCDFGSVSSSIFPKNLLILCLRNCNLPSPLDLTELKDLQKLEVVDHFGETEIVPNSIACMWRLEELNIPGGFTPDGNAGYVDISNEVCKLSFLKNLKIFFGVMPKFLDRNMAYNLVEFSIAVGVLGGGQNCVSEPPAGSTSSARSVSISEDTMVPFGEALMERAEEVKLYYVDGLKDGLSNREAYEDLTKLEIVLCYDMKQVARTIPQSEIIQLRGQPMKYFSNLAVLIIRGCSKMKYIFDVNVAKCLQQLQKLEVEDCEMLEEIVRSEGPSDGGIINFPKLKCLIVTESYNLTRFYREKRLAITEEAPSSESFFCEKVAFPSLEILEIDGWVKFKDDMGWQLYREDQEQEHDGSEASDGSEEREGNDGNAQVKDL